MSHPGWLLVPAVFSFSFTWAHPAPAQGGQTCFEEQQKLLASDGSRTDRFGNSVSVFGDTAVVGAYRDFIGSFGSAYVFSRSGRHWSEQAKLMLSNGGILDRFGESVCVFGDTILIGAPYQEDAVTQDVGSVYVYVRTGSTWNLQAHLEASDAAAFDYFGCAVALAGDTAVVGAYGDDDHGPYSGSAYVFVRVGASWTQQAKILPSDGAAQDFFGRSVAVDGDTVLVGAHFDDDDGLESGSAYVFERNGASWTQQAKLLSSNGSTEDTFGCSVSLSADTALVGAGRDSVDGVDSGSAYVFVRSVTTWTEEARLVPNELWSGAGFGTAVSLSGDTALVGTHGEEIDGIHPGSSYVFVRNGTRWAQQARLLASDGADDDRFGRSVSVDGTTVFVGAFDDDDNGTDSGSAYVFDLPTQPGTIYCTCPAGLCGNPDADAGCANTTGEGAQLLAFGTTSPDEVDLLVEGARPGMFAVFFQADGAVMLPFGDGFRCADGGVVYLTPFPQAIGRDGRALFGPCHGDPTISSITGVVPGSGDTKRYQFWYRDPGGPCGSNFNLSNGYEITW